MKRTLRALLSAGDLEGVGRLAAARPPVLGALVPHTYATDTELAWRAVEALGVAAEQLARVDPAPVREQLRRLLWLISEESGGICWRAPEAMAEMVARNPVAFADYIPIIVHLLVEFAEEDLDHFRPGVLWAIGRLGALAHAEVADVLPQLAAALGHRDAQVRGLAVRALRACGYDGVVAATTSLQHDDGTVELYEDGRLRRTTVRSLCHSVEPGGLA